jgi:4-hydroxy-3-methylbut-2-enyl diphosphate reductase
MASASPKPVLKVLLCSPSGFCAGVVRAIESVEKALAIYGAPVYVRHEIVHNRYVVEGLRAKGAIFVEELSEVPDDHAPVIFSAHGVARAIPRRRRDATLHDRRDLPAGDQGASRGRDS